MNSEGSQLPYPFGEANTDEKVLSEVLNALHHQTGVPNESVKVGVKGGHVTLTGIVAQSYERELAEQSASEAPGVVQVTNLIKVES